VRRRQRGQRARLLAAAQLLQPEAGDDAAEAVADDVQVLAQRRVGESGQPLGHLLDGAARTIIPGDEATMAAPAQRPLEEGEGPAAAAVPVDEQHRRAVLARPGLAADRSQRAVQGVGPELTGDEPEHPDLTSFVRLLHALESYHGLSSFAGRAHGARLTAEPNRRPPRGSSQHCDIPSRAYKFLTVGSFLYLTRARRPATSARAPRVYNRTIQDFLRDLSAPVRRFWIAVVLTGALAGLAAAIFVQLLEVVQALSWGNGGIHEASEAAAHPVRRLIITTAAGVLVAGLAWRCASRSPGTAPPASSRPSG
jgi:hypothetical protein